MTWGDLERADADNLARLLVDPRLRDHPQAAVFALTIAFALVLMISTYAELGPEAWHELRDDTAWTMAVLTALTAILQANKRKGR